MSLSDLMYEPNEYAMAVEWYRMTRLDPKKHLNDIEAEKLLAIAQFGVEEMQSALDLADEMGQHYFEEQVTAGELDTEDDR